MNLKSTSGKPFFRFPKDDALRQSWLDSMGSPMYKPAHGERLCSDHFTQNCFSDERCEVLLSDAVPSVFDPSAFSSVVLPAKTPKPAPKPKPKQLMTTYLKHPLSGPVTLTLPPSSQLILLPREVKTELGCPGSAVPASSQLPAPSSIDAVTMSANCSRTEEQPQVFLIDDDNVKVSENPPSQLTRGRQRSFHVIKRENALATAKRRLMRKKNRFRSSERRLAAINKVLFSERTLYRDGKKIVEISLSSFAKEVLQDCGDTEFNNGETSAPSKHATSDFGESSNSMTNDTLWDDDGNSMHIETIDVSPS